jgi:hypothetical protein
MRMLLNDGQLGNARILGAKTVHLMEVNQIGAVFVSLQPVGLPEATRRFPWERAATSSVWGSRSPAPARMLRSIAVPAV